LNQRAGQLEQFFNVFLAHPEVKNNKYVITYFMDKAQGDKESEEAI
jgi:hypothetical protein